MSIPSAFVDSAPDPQSWEERPSDGRGVQQSPTLGALNWSVDRLGRSLTRVQARTGNLRPFGAQAVPQRETRLADRKVTAYSCSSGTCSVLDSANDRRKYRAASASGDRL